MAGSMQQFVLLPARCARAAEGRRTATRPSPALLPLPVARGMRVIDSVRPEGATLVELSPEAASALRAAHPGVRIAPVVYYEPMLARHAVLQPAGIRKLAGAAIHVTARTTGAPIEGALVVAFTDFAARAGAEAETDASGVARLPLPRGVRLQRLYVYPRHGFWSLLRRNIELPRQMALPLRPLDLRAPDALRRAYGSAPRDAGAGVRVGIIDAGVGPHAGVRVAGGECTVPGEPPADWSDVRDGHGTHVAGIVAARGAAPADPRGLAPGAELFGYRVFPRGGGPASNYAIAKAIDRAVEAGCDVVNLSLGAGAPDEVLQAAVAEARLAGTLIVVASGNDYRAPVRFPAAYALSVAVGACGRKGTFPRGSACFGEVAAPYGADPSDFVAAFSNAGPPADLIAPGVAIISTVPGGYAVMDGTSMACAAATGRAACLLSNRPDVLAQPRTAARSEAMAQALYHSARPLGFGPNYEGHGMPG